MRESTVEEKFLYVLQELSSLYIPSTGRQRVVIAAEPHSRARRAAQPRYPSWSANSEHTPVHGGAIEATSGESGAAAAARQLKRGMRDAGAGINGLSRLNFGHHAIHGAPDAQSRIPGLDSRQAAEPASGEKPASPRARPQSLSDTRTCLAAEHQERTDRDEY